MQLFEYFTDITSETGCDGYFISSPTTIQFLTGFQGFSSHERDAFMFITKNESFLLTSALYFDEVIQHSTNSTVVLSQGLTYLADFLIVTIREQKLQKIGYESDNMTVHEWKTLMNQNFPNIGVSLLKLRVRKSKKEITYIQKACTVADTALQHVIPFITPGITEEALAFQLEMEIRKVGCALAFPTIVAFGPNSAIPHHITDNTKLKKTDTILIDFGASYKGYASDMTRTIYIGRQKSATQKLYMHVLKAQQQSVIFVKDLLKKQERIHAADVDAVARDYLIEAGYPAIPHALGHGIGLAVHEQPSISSRSHDILQEGMVFSIEPGVYLNGLHGVRIEDLYTISQGTLKQLTHFPEMYTVL